MKTMSVEQKTGALPVDRYLGPDDHQKAIALQLYEGIKTLPVVAPHGHVDPQLFASPNVR